MSNGIATRVSAARVLDVVLHRGRSLKATLAAALPALADPRDRALVEAIVFTALRQRARFDAALEAWLAKPLGARDHELRAQLHAGFAQLSLGMPDHAVVAATVDAARALGRPHQAGLVNAVLRRAQREGLPAAGDEAAWPRWLAQRIRTDWPGQADAIFAASAEEAPMWLRVHARATTRDGYLERLHEAGIDGQVDASLPDAIRLDAALPVQQLPGFGDGVVSVQDGAAQRVADALSPRPQARVLDACAAPGGKAAHLLERDPALELLALEVDPRRLPRLEDTLRRAGVADRAQVRAADATLPALWWDGFTFDAILLDAPCSATGVVRRQPDILLHRRPEDLEALVQSQARLLDATWPLLRPGGILLYATCSILPEENVGQVEAFLARTGDAVAVPLADAFGHRAGPGRQRLPGEDGMDGFFYSRLRKAG